MKAALLCALTAIALAGCERSHVNIDAPGLSIHASGRDVSVSGHLPPPMDDSQVGQVQSETRGLAAFHRIEVGSGIEVEFSKGATQLVKVAAASGVLRLVSTKVTDGLLTISFDGVDKEGIIKVELVAPALDSVRLTGASHATLEHLHEPTFVAEADGASILNANGELAELKVNFLGASKGQFHIDGGCKLNMQEDGASEATLSGSFTGADCALSGASTGVIQGLSATTFVLHADAGSRLEADGAADSLTASVSGAADAELAQLVAKACRIEADGGAQATLNVSDSLDAHLTGGSHVTYSGHPTVHETEEGGAQLTHR